MTTNLRESMAQIRLLALDFDGVMTDNKVLVMEDGREAVVCDRSDSLGIGQLVSSGTGVIVISKEKNPVVTARCRKLNIPAVQGIDDKLPTLQEFGRQRGLDAGVIAYMGNDTNDLECLAWAGLSFAPADAHFSVLSQVDIVTPQLGGKGAVRQVTDWLTGASSFSS
jgi:YrbI family 3-deoxy-D-manno-octulosonate 8-phosphate phosphatase